MKQQPKTIVISNRLRLPRVTMKEITFTIIPERITVTDNSEKSFITLIPSLSIKKET